MKGAIASVEIFGVRPEEPVRRFTLTVSAPVRRSAAPEGGSDSEPAAWECRVGLADLHRPQSLVARDSVCALQRALDLARTWIAELRADGFALYRDRAGEVDFDSL